MTKVVPAKANSRNRKKASCVQLIRSKTTVTKSTIAEDCDVSTVKIKDEYKEVFCVALEYKIKNAKNSGSVLSVNIEQWIKKTIMNVIVAGQNGNIPPEKVMSMIIASSNKEHSHRNWPVNASLEQQHGLLVGAKRTVKIS